jgi:hypothetical protein
MLLMAAISDDDDGDDDVLPKPEDREEMYVC